MHHTGRLQTGLVESIFRIEGNEGQTVCDYNIPVLLASEQIQIWIQKILHIAKPTIFKTRCMCINLEKIQNLKWMYPIDPHGDGVQAKSFPTTDRWPKTSECLLQRLKTLMMLRHHKDLIIFSLRSSWSSKSFSECSESPEKCSQSFDGNMHLSQQ